MKDTLPGVTAPLIGKALAITKRDANAHYRAGRRSSDGHFERSTRTVAALRISVRVHRNGVEEISLSASSRGDNIPVPEEVITQVIGVHQREFGVRLETALDAKNPDGSIAWVVLRPKVEASVQTRLV